MSDLNNYNKFNNLLATRKNINDFDTYQSRIIDLTDFK